MINKDMIDQKGINMKYSKEGRPWAIIQYKHIHCKEIPK